MVPKEILKSVEFPPRIDKGTTRFREFIALRVKMPADGGKNVGKTAAGKAATRKSQRRSA